MILVVGVGGIGCELVKNLILSGHKQIHLIDLDTIELTNLNRQFLFQPKYIGQAKATVAAQVLLDQYGTQLDELQIVAHVGNLFNGEKFPPSFFAQFSLIYGALDNLEARMHLNKICLTLQVPLIETGSAGYLGQTSVIVAGRTECFDCNEHPTPSVYPVCTIKNTPNTIVHCAIWAKEFLFNTLFGTDVTNEYAEDKECSFFSNLIGQQSDEAVQALATKIFIQDVERLREMPELWEHRDKPVPLSVEQIQQALAIGCPFYQTLQEHHCYSIDDWLQLFLAAFSMLVKNRTLPLVFDKDDDDAVKFVAAATNIRASIYGIDFKSLFEVKAIAGSIIPAVATTNSIVAGLAVISGNKLLSNRLFNYNTYFIAYGFENKLLTNQRILTPNPDCKTCTCYRALLTVKSFEQTTILNILDYFYQNFDADAEITITNGSKLLYDVDYEANINTSLHSLGLQQGQFLTLSAISLVEGVELTNNFEFLLSLSDKIEERFVFSRPISSILRCKKQKNE